LPSIHPPIQVDDNNANNHPPLTNFSITGSGWTTIAATGAYLGSEHVHAGNAKYDTAEATWSYIVKNITPGAPYTVYASWGAALTNATNATYKIYLDSLASGPVATVVVDQTQDPNSALFGTTALQKLATINMPYGSHTVIVVLSNLANGTVVADGIFDPPATQDESAGVDSAAAPIAPTQGEFATINPSVFGIPDPTLGRFGSPTAGAPPDPVSPAPGAPLTDAAALVQFFADKSGAATNGAMLDLIVAGSTGHRAGGSSDLTGPLDAPGLDGSGSEGF